MWCHSTTTFKNFLGNLLKLFVSITLRACRVKREESLNKSWQINAINTSGDCRQSLESPQDFRKSLRISATATLHYRWLFSNLVREPRITLILAWSTTLSFSIEKQRNKCPVTKKGSNLRILCAGRMTLFGNQLSCYITLGFLGVS